MIYRRRDPSHVYSAILRPAFKGTAITPLEIISYNAFSRRQSQNPRDWYIIPIAIVLMKVLPATSAAKSSMTSSTSRTPITTLPH
jgi:hypothetical protein